MHRGLQVVVWLLAAMILSGCMARAATSGRVVVKDDRASVDVVFSSRDRQIIEEYYHGHSHGKSKKAKKVPPGHAKRDSLPPGLAKRDRLPPGLEGRGLPSELEVRLSPLPAPYVRVRVGADVVLMDRHTRIVFDIFRDIAY